MNTITAVIESRAAARSPRAPSLPRVFQQQLKLIGQAGAASMGMMVLGGAALLFLGMDPRIAKLPFPDDYLPLTGLLLGAVAWPPLVWRGQGPTRRNYHRTLPVDQFTHDMLKIGAGALWLMLGIAVVLLPLLVAANLSTTLRGLVTGPSLLVWVNFFTGPLIVYLLLSCIPMLTDRPLEWMLGLTAGFVGLTMLADTYDLALKNAIDVIMRSELGLVNALNGAYVEQPWLTYVRLSHYPDRMDYGAWIGATLLWLVIGIAAVCVTSNFVNSRKSA